MYELKEAKYKIISLLDVVVVESMYTKANRKKRHAPFHLALYPLDPLKPACPELPLMLQALNIH